MGFFSAIKEILRLRKELRADIKNFSVRQAEYIKMTADELAALSDPELYEALLARTDDKIEGCGSIEDGMRKMSEPERVFYAVSYLEIEVNNGGLCQFFVNSSRAVAPFVSDYMGVIGADGHKKLYDDFIGRYGIDVGDLSSFDCETTKEFSAQYERYPFDEFDDAFYEMEPLQKYLTVYAREHIDSF